MNRHDMRWIGVRGTGFFFLAKTILVAPAVIHGLRVQEAIFGPASSETAMAMNALGVGAAGLVTSLAVYALAAAALLLIPVGGSGARG